MRIGISPQSQAHPSCFPTPISSDKFTENLLRTTLHEKVLLISISLYYILIRKFSNNINTLSTTFIFGNVVFGFVFFFSKSKTVLKPSSGLNTGSQKSDLHGVSKYELGIQSSHFRHHMLSLYDYLMSWAAFYIKWEWYQVISELSVLNRDDWKMYCESQITLESLNLINET